MTDALSILDGRNEADVKELKRYFSETALNFYRVVTEVNWVLFMSMHPEIPLRKLTKKEEQVLSDIIDKFNEKDAKRIKEIEKITNHDVKAVEIFLREKFTKTSLKDIVEWIHFAATSEDINNVAYALMLKDAIFEVILPELDSLENALVTCAKTWKSTPMLSRTHGQPASPTTVGKEFAVFSYRLKRQIKQLENQEFLAKFAGATGNFNAHKAAFSSVDWLSASEEFISGFDLDRNPITTQIEPHDFIAEISHVCSRINTILIDFARDIWMMISFDFFRQEALKGEVGSSVMPHKVNPIDFENAEGNFGVANSFFKFFAEKLPISRLQRDLSDSTVLRSIGPAFGYMLLALKKLQKGIGKLKINENMILEDLQNHPEVLAEAVQTVMRVEGIANPYNKLKEFTRGKKIDLEELRKFIQSLELSEEKKKYLLGLTPEKYIGIAEEIVEYGVMS